MSSSTSTLDSPLLSAFTGAPGYAERVNELVARIPGAADEGEALDLLADATELLGAEVAAFGSFIRDDGSYESFRFLLACDAVWCHLYEERTWYAADPWLRYASRHSEPIRASEIRVASRAEREVVELAAEFGFRSAVIVPAPSSGGLTRLGVLCLGSSQLGYFEGDGYFALRVAARSVAMELNAWWVNRIRREMLEETRVTEEELFLLRQEREGLTTKAIASAMSMSLSSIDSRFQRVNQKLGVPNRKAAATVAAEYGLI